MSNYFEKITQKILDQIHFFSTNIQEYVDLKIELHRNQYIFYEKLFKF